jgi:hypothetical protein
MLMPPESNVIALPTNPILGSFAAFLPAGLYFKTINLGSFAEPDPTANKPPIPFSINCRLLKTLQLTFFKPLAILLASADSVTGLIAFPGRLVRVLA